MTSKHTTTPPPRDLQITTTTTTTTTTSSPSSSSAVTLHHLSASSTRPPSRIASASGQNQACAACKYQRRKCNPDCPLARYFPADQQRCFLNAHRLFGVGNIQRTLRETPPELRNDAMRALIYHAEVRAYDPVGGCYRLVELHDRQLFILQAELEALNQHLEACRGKIRQTEQPLLDDGSGSGSGMMMLVGAGPHVSDMPAEDALYAAAAAHEIDYGQPSSADHYILAAADQAPHQLYDYAYSYYDGAAGDETSSHAWSNNMQHYGNNNNGIIVKDDGSPVASLGDDLIETTQFVDVFDVKPDIAGAATAVGMEHDAGSDDSFDHHQLEEKMVATVVKHELLDHQHQAASQMAAESSAAVSRCQLELGFSSF